MSRLLYLLVFLTFSLPAVADDMLSLYQLAVLASPELNSSEYALEIARAQEDQAFGRLSPMNSVPQKSNRIGLPPYRRVTDTSMLVVPYIIRQDD